MNERILVTYASQGGSTAGVAEAIGRELAQNGLALDVLPVKEVKDVHGYRAAVLGSAIHSGKWMPEMLDFAARHQDVLRRMPTAAFQVCLTLAAGNESYKRMLPDWFAPLHACIRPLAEESFAGALWPQRHARLSEKLGLRIFLAVIKLKPGDYRDWQAIQAWAGRIRPLLCR